MKTLGWYGPALLSLFLVSRGPADDPDELLREGNAAFARGDYAGALEVYSRAEERTHDPGRVAFNEATALYRLGRFREAELYYRRCREDADETRRGRVLYNLGTCVLRQSAGHSRRRLDEAIGLFEECLALPAADPDLHQDARHNLELARLLRLQAPAGQPPDAESEPPEEEPPRERPKGVEPSVEAQRAADGRRQGRAEPAFGARDEAGAGAENTAQAPPGKGNLPVLPDEDALVPMTPEEATEYLRQAADRIEHDRRTYRRQAVPTLPSTVPDW
jgi:tetratricopeptide (TPR) repeat protein